MNRNSAIVVVLAIIVIAAVGTYIYHERHNNSVEITIGNNGVKVQGPSN